MTDHRNPHHASIWPAERLMKRHEIVPVTTRQELVEPLALLVGPQSLPVENQ